MRAPDCYYWLPGFKELLDQRDQRLTCAKHRPSMITLAVTASLSSPSFKSRNGEPSTTRGNRWKTALRVFRKRELAKFWGKLCELREKKKTRWVHFGTQNRLRGLTEFVPQSSARPQKTHRARCLKPCSPKRYLALFRHNNLNPAIFNKRFPAHGAI